jgi:hypothetical protein
LFRLWLFGASIQWSLLFMYFSFLQRIQYAWRILVCLVLWCHLFFVAVGNNVRPLIELLNLSTGQLVLISMAFSSLTLGQRN